ncbi:kelch-like protein 3 [Clonorchis sinensis]|uniref:Kelch-like protein 3 n=1 Tax=Clonorchis sinensis TaxID=79923 RepID=H2KQD4_CLOSI|nr:kelch-like protein 3 [Clonorchis sinensis]
MMVGVGLVGADFNYYAPRYFSALGRMNIASWGLSYRGDVVHCGQRENHNLLAFNRGSIVGCFLDLWHGKLQFFVDGKTHGYSKLLNLPRGAFYPMVCSTASRSGFRLIRTKTFDMSLQLLACRAIRDNRLLPLLRLLPSRLRVSEPCYYQLTTSHAGAIDRSRLNQSPFRTCRVYRINASPGIEAKLLESSFPHAAVFGDKHSINHSPMSDVSNGLANRTRYQHGSNQENRVINPSLSSTSSHVTYALPSSRLSWRSRSQPPFGDAGHHNRNGNNLFDHQSPVFLNTESNQQMSSAGAEFPTTSGGPNSAIRTISYTTVGGSNRYRNSLNNPSRALNGARPSTSRRTLRSIRFQPNQETTGLSSSSSNTSLTGRYRTISGVTNREPVEETHGLGAYSPHLFRFASLRLDTTGDREASPSQPVPLAVQEGSSDLDEFPALPVRSTAEQPMPNTVSCSVITPMRPLRDRPVSDGVVTGLLMENYSRSIARGTAGLVNNHPSSGADSNSQALETSSTPNTIAHPVSEDVVSATSTDSHEMEAQISRSLPSSSVIVRFPLRESRIQAHAVGSSGTSNPHQEPEADHDFYRCDLPRSPYRSSDQIRRVLNGVNELRHSGQFCDVILQAGSTKIPAHRNILASSSKYFYAMFTGPMAEARSACVKIHDIDETALNQLIDFIYTGEICVTEDTVQTLLPAANLLQLNSVRDACCDFLQSQLHPSNCLGIQRFADLHDCPDLLASSRRFTEQHFGELLEQDEEFLALTADQLVQLISSDQLAVSEDRVFEAVLRWVAHDVEQRQAAAPSLCSRVRFSLLPRDYLVRLSQSDTFLAANPWCKDYLIEALSYHLLSWEQKLLVNSERAKPRTPIGLPKILIVVGGQAPKAVRSVEYFEFRTGHWSLPPSTIADLPSRRCRCGVAVVGGLVYVVGGFNGALRVRSVEVYDPARNSWHSGPNMECRRATLGVAVLNGRIYAVGGFDGNAGLNTAEVLDLCSGSWRFISPMSCRRSSVGAGALDGKIYAVGGYDGIARRCLSSVECYDPVANTWTPIADMTCRRSGPAVGELNNRLYAVGGHDGPVVRNTSEVYSPETGTWQRIADLNVRRRNAGLVAHDGFLYVVGGEDGEANLPSVEKYDPSTNTWTLLPGQMKLGRSYAGVAVIERTAFV